MTEPISSASPEVLQHHADQHGCPPGDWVVRSCPCGGTVSLCCHACGAPVFALAPNGEMCKHLEFVLNLGAN